MKVAIIYPAKDYTAADISYKLKAFTEGRGLRVVISKKNTRAFPEDHVKRNSALFKDVEVALFLMYDAPEIDLLTIEEIAYLISKKVPIYAIIPGSNLDANQVLVENGVENIYKYRENDPQHFMSVIENIINDIKKAYRDVPVENRSNDVIGSLIALLGFILLILVLYDLLKKK